MSLSEDDKTGKKLSLSPFHGEASTSFLFYVLFRPLQKDRLLVCLHNCIIIND